MIKLPKIRILIGVHIGYWKYKIQEGVEEEILDCILESMMKGKGCILKSSTSWPRQPASCALSDQSILPTLGCVTLRWAGRSKGWPIKTFVKKLRLKFLTKQG